MTIKRLRQPTDNSCGQTAVAMIAGQDVWDVAKVMGTKGKTRTSHVINALRHFGFSTAERLCRVNANTQLPSLALLKIKHPTEKVTHWVVHHNGELYDPWSEVCLLKSGWKLQSYLEVQVLP